MIFPNKYRSDNTGGEMLVRVLIVIGVIALVVYLALR
jgi:hypothetical protein